MRLALILASGRIEGDHYLEDLVDIAGIMELMGRMPQQKHWVTAASKAAQDEHLGSLS